MASNKILRKNNSKIYFNGSKWKTNSGEYLEIIDKSLKKDYFICRFNDGTEVERSMSSIRDGKITNPNSKKEIIIVKKSTLKNKYKPTVAGIGYIWNINFKLNENKLYQVWRGMLSRCYSPKNKQYKYYGVKGVYVEEYFHSFENFYNHVSKLENYDLLLSSNDYNVDKDKLSKDYKVYSRETICIILQKDNLKLAGKRGGAVLCLDKDKNIIAEYETAYEAANKTNNIEQNIRKCLFGDRITCGGLYWVYKEKYTKNYTPRKKVKRKPSESKRKIKIIQMDLKGKEIKIWNSLTEASNELNIKISGISLCINGKNKTAKGFKFKKVEEV